MRYIYILLLTFELFSCKAQQINKVAPVLPEVIDFNNVRDFTINSLENEIYFSLQSPLGDLSAIVQMQKFNGEWQNPTLANFSGRWQDLEPFLSQDGLSLYFASNRPTSDTSNIAGDFNIWKVVRKTYADKWSEPINIGAPVNSENNEFYASIASNGNLYFTSDAPTGKGKDDIYVSEFIDGKYSSPVSLSDSINTEGYEFNAFIAPDESYLIFSGYNRADGLGSGDMYISYNKNGVWTKAQNLGDKINSKQMDYCPYVDENNKILYFTSKRNSISNEQQFNSLDEYLQTINQSENGLSRIYKVDFNEWFK